MWQYLAKAPSSLRVLAKARLLLAASNNNIPRRLCAAKVDSATQLRFDANDDYYSEDYAWEFQRSLVAPEEYWAEKACYIKWMKPWNKVLDDTNSPFTKWFPGGMLNVCYNALDRHVDDGFGYQIALIHDSPVTRSPPKSITYQELLEMVEKLAGVYSSHGVRKGDRVLIYMPMIPEAVAAMLACARLGAIHSLVFGGFSPRELSTRINHARPKLLITTDCGYEPNRVVEYKRMVDQALMMSSEAGKAALKHVVVFNRGRGLVSTPMTSKRDIEWDEAMDKALPHSCVPVESDHPLYILYTSGTTGDPKGVQRPSGGHAVALTWSMDAIFGMNPGDTWWAASDLGWVVGHSYICYGPLLRRLTSVIYEGKPVGTPDAGQYFRVIQNHKVKSLFTSPTALRAIRREDRDALEGAKYDIQSLKSLFVAGEHCDYETREWAEKNFKAPALDNWWQTETGHPISASCLGFGHSKNPPRDVSGMPVPGYDVRVLNADGTEAKRGELGRIVVTLPLPPGCLSTLYGSDDRFCKSYFKEFPGYYDTMDAGFMDEHGYICVMSRDDDVINVAGHRLSTSAIEEALLEHPDVVDCAVFGVPDSVKGEVPLGLFVLSKGSTKEPMIVAKELVELVRELVGPVAAFRLAASVPALPRTRSGKTARKSMADLARNKQIKLSATIEDPSVYEGVVTALRSLGFARNAPQLL